MLVAPPCSSKSKYKKAALIVSVLGATLLTGCSATTLEKNTSASKKVSSTAKTVAVKQEKKSDAKKEIRVISSASKKTAQKLDLMKTASTKRYDVVDYNESAACRYLRTSSEVEATIIGSPTVSASSDEDGSGSVSIGMNILDLKKADLVRATGDARCRIQTASKEINATLGVGSEMVKFAGYDAQQAHIRNKLAEMNALQVRAKQLVAGGVLTKQDANIISIDIDTMKANMEIAKSEAQKRAGLPSMDIKRLQNRHAALVEATNDLQEIEREIRTTDALELSVSTGYRYNDQFNNDSLTSENDGTFARVNIGIRLGALSDRRRHLEQEAATAREDALFEENTGIIWKSDFAERAIARMVKDLRQSEIELSTAIAKTNDTINRLAGAERSEVIRAFMLTKIRRVNLGANLASVNARIKQLEKNQAAIRRL